MVFRMEPWKPLVSISFMGLKKVEKEEEEQNEIAAKDALVTYKNHKLAWTNLTTSFMITILKNIISRRIGLDTYLYISRHLCSVQLSFPCFLMKISPCIQHINNLFLSHAYLRTNTCILNVQVSGYIFCSEIISRLTSIANFLISTRETSRF